jgi:transposase InsO family protein
MRGLAITRPNLVWAMDITYIPMARGFVYLTACSLVLARDRMSVEARTEDEDARIH